MRISVSSRAGLRGALVLAAASVAACAPATPPGGAATPNSQTAPVPPLQQVPPAAPAAPAAAPAQQSDTEQVAAIPYDGAFGPATPPDRAPASQKPLDGWVKQTLVALYQRPAPDGPAAIPLATPRALYAVGKSPVIQVLPGPAVFPEKVPEHIRKTLPPKLPFSNNVKRIRDGEIRIVAFDRTLNDTKLSKDSLAATISFTDAQGSKWRIEQAMLAPVSPNPVSEPWFGGVAIDTLYHGQTGNGTPAEPLVRCELCSWGWADVYKDGKRVASSAPLHLMVTSRVRDDRHGFRYACYDCSANPVSEVHVIVHPSAYLPSPGGFLHIMWENVEVHRGSPEQIERMAPKLAQNVPTIELSAVPYLKWDKKEIHVTTGQKYRLLVHNTDPSSFHQFRLHDTPVQPGEQDDDVRHEEGGAAGGIGPLWKPGQQDSKKTDTGAPEHVFFPLPQNSTWATYVEFDKPGEYMFMCPVANHHRRGMEGKFIVTSASGTAAAGSGSGAVLATSSTRAVEARKQ